MGWRKKRIIVIFFGVPLKTLIRLAYKKQQQNENKLFIIIVVTMAEQVVISCTMRSKNTMLLLVVLLLLQLGFTVSQKAAQKKPVDVNDNKGNTPFFLQDPQDQTCLGPNGFTVCDERSLWVLTRRAGKKTYSLVSLLNPSPYGMCLERKYSFFGLFGSDRVGMGLCSQGGSKNWDFNFVDKTHVKISTKGQCLVRGKKKFMNSISVQNCNKGEFTPLVYHPTSVHEAGFYLKAADGACFDGEKFRSCEGRGADHLLWGVGNTIMSYPPSH